MKDQAVINKVVVTEESIFDYEEIITNHCMPKSEIKQEIELYIDIKNKSHRLLYERNFRVKFFDETVDKVLLLFLVRAERIGVMQLWRIEGVCEAQDWTKALENDGQIRYWLKSKISDLPKDDWVLDLRNRQKRGLVDGYMVNEQDDYNIVKELLSNYKINWSRIEVCDNNDLEINSLTIKMKLLDKCIDSLSEEDRELIIDVYIKKMSLARIGKKLGYAKTTILRKRDKLIAILKTLFAENYIPNIESSRNDTERLSNETGL